VKSKTLVTLSLLVFVFLLGFSFSVQAYALRQQELNSPVSQYLRENYGVNSFEEYEAKLEQEAWLNYSRQMKTLANQYPELNLPQSYMQVGTSTYQPPKITPQQPFYTAIFSEPVTALQIFSFSGLGLLGLVAVPPVRKNKRLKQALVLGIVVLCVFSIGYFVGLTAAQTGTINIEPASLSGDYSYLVETDGTYVWAKSGETGEVVYGGQWNAGGVSGTNAVAVIQSALNALTSGRTWMEKVVLKGDFTLTDSIVVDDWTYLQILGKLTLANNVNKSIIVNKNYENGNNGNIIIEGGLLDGNKANQTSGHGIDFRNSASNEGKPIQLRHIRIQNVKQDGIHLSYLFEVHIFDCSINQNNYVGGWGLYCSWVYDAHVSYCMPLDGEQGGLYFTGGCAKFTNLYINTGIWLSSCDRCEFDHINVYIAEDKYAIYLNYNVTDCIFTNIIIECARDGATTYAAIELGQPDSPSSACKNNIFDGIWAKRGWGAGTRKFSYAVEEAVSTCDYNIFSNINAMDCAVGAVRVQGAHSVVDSPSIIDVDGKKWVNSGTATFSGNGSQTQFTIAHGLAGTPKSWRVEAGSADAKGDKYVTADATNIYVTFATAPPTGSNNVVLVWSAEM